MVHLARIAALSMLFLFFAQPVIAQQIVSQQILEPASSSPYEHSLCVWTLPPCAEEGTCRAHGFVATSPTPNSTARMEVRMGRRPGTPKREGYWHIWGYVIDATGKQYNTALFMETDYPCVSVTIHPAGPRDTVRLLLRTETARHITRRIVKGMGTHRYTASRVGVWVEGTEPPSEEDVYVEALYYTRETTLGSLREVGLERGEPGETGLGQITVLPFLSPGADNNS